MQLRPQSRWLCPIASAGALTLLLSAPASLARRLGALLYEALLLVAFAALVFVALPPTVNGPHRTLTDAPPLVLQSSHTWSAEIVDQIASLDLVDDLPLAYAVIAAAVVIGVGTWRTGFRLRAFNLTGDE